MTHPKTTTNSASSLVPSPATVKTSEVERAEDWSTISVWISASNLRSKQ
jgi:hypothetical protein